MPFIVMLWLFVAIGFIVLELMVPGLFVFLSLSVGALSALGLYVFGYSFLAQIITFLLVTCMSFIGLWYWFKALIPAPTPTNVYGLIGKRGIVTQPINALQGALKVEGQVWSARCQSGKELGIGASVIVVAVQGCHCIVKHSEEII